MKEETRYTFKPYHPLFHQLFEEEKRRLICITQILGIEHVGSTAVEGLGGKGIIDLAVSANKKDFEVISTQLQQLGYKYNTSFSTAERYFLTTFRPDPEETTRRYHLHLTHPESNEWRELLEFRDYLRSHPSAVTAYSELKKKAAEQANQDGAIYRKIKDPFFKSLPI